MKSLRLEYVMDLRLRSRDSNGSMRNFEKILRKFVNYSKMLIRIRMKNVRKFWNF